MLDTKSERALAQIAAQVRQLFGSDLVSLVLYGSAAGDEFVPGRSDLNLAIVLDRVRFTHLKALHRYVPGWRKLGAAMPLLLDRRFLARGCDVFPMEFSDIKAQHRVLYGEEVFATLPIDQRLLRYQSEYEARARLLRLRALYAEVGADRHRLEALMLDSAKTFVVIMRGILRLQGEECSSRYVEIIDRFEQRFGVRFPTFGLLMHINLGQSRSDQPLEDGVEAYLGEVERLIEIVDGVVAVPPGTPGLGAGGEPADSSRSRYATGGEPVS